MAKGPVRPIYGKHCEGCPLYTKQKFVMFDSPEQTELAVIGESPGRTELLDRKPFIGESGRLLNHVFGLLGVDRSHLFVSNIAQCRAVGMPDTKPTDEVKERCGWIGANLMYRHGVTRILSLGGIAMNYFMGTSGASIMRNRGKPFRSRPFKLDGELRTFEVFPTFHPAAILRRPDGFGEFLEDIQLFFDPSSAVEYEPGDYFIVDNLEEALWHMACWKSPVVIDLETSGYSPHMDRILCIAFADRPKKALVFTYNVISQRAFWAKVKELNDSAVEWIMHGGFFDHRFVMQKTGIDLNIYMDTMLANYVLDERGGVHDLKKIAAKRFGFPDWEAEIKTYLKRSTIDSYASIPREVLHEYASYDADAEYRLADVHGKTLSEKQWDLLRDVLQPGTVTLGRMSLSGISIDMEHWARLADRYELMVDSAREYMREVVDDQDFNPNSFKQVQHWMYDVFDLPTHDKSAKLGHHPKLSSGRTSQLPPRTTAMDQLERLSEGYPQSTWIQALILYRTKRKAITSYLKGYKPIPKTGRIHPRYLVHGTRTGRLSSRDPNIMNAPHYGFIRELIIPREGCILASVDYSQAELRVLAALSRSEMMADVYRAGGDLHAIVSTEIFGKGYSKRERMIAKAIVFGLVYGRSVSNIAETFGIPLEKAYEYRYTFMGRFDGVEAWMQRQKEFALENGYVELPTGRRRRFRLITRSNASEVQRQAVNTPVQGTASDLMFISIIELYEYIKSIGGNMLFPLHDSIMFELPLMRWKEAVIRIVDVMEEVPRRIFGDFLPFAADCDIGWRWGRMVEFKKDQAGVLRVDEEQPKWWPDAENYQAGATIEGFAVYPEDPNWYKKLVWEDMPWEVSNE